MAHFRRETRRILLIDGDPLKQNLRATILRNHEVEVHVASGIRDAERLLTSNFYDLMLVAAEENSEESLTLPEQIRRSRPNQRIALLVGAPTYIKEVGGLPKRAIKTRPMRPSGFTSRMDAISPPQWQEMIQRLLSGQM